MQVRDLFLFQIYSGLAYADLMALNKEDLQTADGQYFVKKERIKTGVNFISVVDKKGIDIWEKYNWELPKYTNQRYNNFFKFSNFFVYIFRKIGNIHHFS